MMESKDPKFETLEMTSLAQLAVQCLKGDTVTDFDLYLDMGGGHIILYAPSPYTWSAPEISRLQADGYSNMLYSKNDETKKLAYKKISSILAVDESKIPSQRIIDITSAIAELTRVLYEHPLTITGLEKGRDVARSLVRCMKEDPACIQALQLLENHDYYTYYHSARVGAYALAVAIKMSLSDQKGLEDLALGAILHDIGKSQVALTVLNKTNSLTPEEWGIMKQHPDFGAKMIELSHLGVVPREIIHHHHERVDGQGYPHGLQSNELLEEVKITSFADVFDALTTNRPYSTARTRYEALDFIRFKMLGHLHKDAYKAMVELLIADPKKAA